MFFRLFEGALSKLETEQGGYLHKNFVQNEIVLFPDSFNMV